MWRRVAYCTKLHRCRGSGRLALKEDRRISRRHSLTIMLRSSSVPRNRFQKATVQGVCRRIRRRLGLERPVLVQAEIQDTPVKRLQAARSQAVRLRGFLLPCRRADIRTEAFQCPCFGRHFTQIAIDWTVVTQVLTLPTVLTLTRVIEIPILIAVWFSNTKSAATLAGGIFVLACITDFLDGFLARKMVPYPFYSCCGFTANLSQDQPVYVHVSQRSYAPVFQTAIARSAKPLHFRHFRSYNLHLVGSGVLPALIGIVPRGLPGSRFHQLSPLQGSYSAFGAFLDPVADKLIVSTALILLSAKPIAAGILMGNAWLLPTLSSAIIGREIAMSALREWAASAGEEAHKAAAVSKLGKWKTTTQMAALALLLSTSGGQEGWPVDVGIALLCIATFLTLFSLYEYLRGLWKYLF